MKCCICCVFLLWSLTWFYCLPGYQPCDPQVICNRVNHVSSCLEELKQLAAKRRAELEESRQLWAFFQVGWVDRCCRGRDYVVLIIPSKIRGQCTQSEMLARCFTQKPAPSTHRGWTSLCFFLLILYSLLPLELFMCMTECNSMNVFQEGIKMWTDI